MIDSFFIYLKNMCCIASYH